MNLRIFVLLACVLMTPTLVPHSAAAAYKEKVLYIFCGKVGCSDVEDAGGLIRDASGKLYSTGAGGSFDRGALFELVPPGAGGTRWTLKVLYSFCPHGGNFCAGPGGLIRGASGAFYGTTSTFCPTGDFVHFCDTVFELIPPATGKTEWTETVLHTFHGQQFADPGLSGGMFRGASGTLYGMTSPGPPFHGGTVFELVPPPAGKTGWTYRVLYRFCTRGGFNCTDGDLPIGGAIQDASGKLYGTTSEGGAYGAGTVFELVPPAAGGTVWQHKVLYSFCGLGCIDGDEPEAGVIRDAAGRLYGTTHLGGTHDDHGTVFELVPPAPGKTAWTEIVLYSFCATALCTDGDGLASVAIRDLTGRLYGTTNSGGADGAGTVFELVPPAPGMTGWTYQVLYSFCARGGRACTDGSFPGTVIRDPSGNLYGATGEGGRFGGGIVFELSP